MNGYVVSVEENAFATEEQKKLSKEAKLLFVDTEETREKYAIPTAFAAYVRLFLDQLRQLSFIGNYSETPHSTFAFRTLRVLSRLFQG